MPPMPPLFRIDVLDRLVERLSELKGVLCELDTFRFYTSSLLITYDGGNGSNHGGSEEEEEVPSQSFLLKCIQLEGLKSGLFSRFCPATSWSNALLGCII